MYRPVTKREQLHREYTFLGTTQSLCPECLQVVPAKIIARGQRVYFRKRCPEHGEREDFVCSQRSWYDRTDVSLPARLPQRWMTKAERGCPYDCGLCPDHEQHTCIGLVEITTQCNLQCPMCFAVSGPGGQHLRLDECLRAIDRLVASEGHADVLQLSGGEPTLHPQLIQLIDEALARPIDYVMINTNGIRIARDATLVEQLASRREQLEIYLQWDGGDHQRQLELRGSDLRDTKRQALERLAAADINVTLVATLQGPLPSGSYRELLNEALRYPNITGLSLQPATYSGRHVLPETLEQRVTFPDVIDGLATESNGQLEAKDFAPLPCGHPNCHQIMLALRRGQRLLPLTRFVRLEQNLDLLANGISFTRDQGRKLIEQFLARQAGCGADCGCGSAASFADVNPTTPSAQFPVAHHGGAAESSTDGEWPARLVRLTVDEQSWATDFLARVLRGEAGARDMLRITITNFLDPYNFDVRRLMKCCTHHVLPSGHVIPFCAYNTLYRNGHLPLPPIAE